MPERVTGEEPGARVREAMMYSEALFWVMGWLATVMMGAVWAVTAGVFVRSVGIAEAVGARERGEVLMGRLAEIGDALSVGFDSMLGWLPKAPAIIAPRPWTDEVGVLGVLEAISSPVLRPVCATELAMGEFIFCACWAVDVGPGAGRWLPKIGPMIAPMSTPLEDFVDCVSPRAGTVLCGWPCAAAHAPGW